MSRLGVLVFLFVLPALARAQGAVPAPAATRFVNGTVTSHGAPVTGVNVFDLETLDGSVTGADGQFRFAIADAARSTIHLIARRIGYRPADTTFAITADSVVVSLDALTALAVMTVQAGRYTANATRTTNLTPIEVASIPGSNADINSAIKTLPGVQNADEGNGLFVRGGDFTETRIFVDGAPLFTPYQFEAPTGSVAGSINPFLTDGITFSSGGFGAEWGNALSGVVDLRTQGRPGQSYWNFNGSILGGAVGGGLALRHHLGITATVGVTDLGVLLALNGNPRKYAPAPRAQTASALAAWEYSRTGTVKIFALKQQNQMGIPVDNPGYSSTFDSNRGNDIAVASWKDSIGVWRPFVSASTSGLSRHESLGAYDQTTTLRSSQLRAEMPFVFTDRATLSVGGEVERVGVNYSGTFPANGYNTGPATPTSASHLDAAKVRDGEFVSLDTRPTVSTELIVGVRTDHSGYTTGRSADPRVSIAWAPSSSVTFTAAWGMYHQVADPAFLDRLQSGYQLPPLRSEMVIAGVQIGENAKQMRLELWTKEYGDLVSLTRSYVTVGGLGGRAHGLDFFARTPAAWEMKYRLTYSGSVSRRTDPNTLLDAPAQFDITHSVTGVAERDWTNGWHVGIAYRYATGKPFTEVSGATFDATSHVYVPQYAAPNASRLPDFNRADVSVSKTIPMGARKFGVVFAGINNLLNQRNTFGYTWSADYKERLLVRSAVSRSYFIGANLTLTGH